MITPTIVIDSSVIIKWLSQDNEKYLQEADKILEDARENKILLIAPELAKYEVGNVLLFGKNLSPSQAEIVLEEFYSLPLSFIPESEKQAIDTFTLASDLKITYYDAAFLSLTKQYDATLITDNIKHQGRNSSIKVVPLKNY